MTDSASRALLQPFLQGDLELKNRVVLAPMTRGRAGEQRLANAVMAEYFDAPYPSRATVAIAALPKGSPVEVEAIAHL